MQIFDGFNYLIRFQIQECELLSTEILTPKDSNVNPNERVFSLVKGPEHPRKVRTQGFGVTPTLYFSWSTTIVGQSNESSDTFARFSILESEEHSI